MSTNFSSIRCPQHRQHAEFDLCGRLLGAIKDGKIYVYCESCKQFFLLEILENDNLEMTPLDKKQRLILKSNLRLLH